MGLIQKGSVIVADNVVYPGAPEYLKYFKEVASKYGKYRSVLYHSYDAYSDVPDAVLVS
jgi:hypothetical protein